MERPWLKNYPYRWDLHYPEISLYDYLRETAERYPERTALIFIGERVGYREMMEKIDRMATAFAAMGLKKGDRVALMLPNCFAYVYCYYAALRLGLVVVQINPLLTARELSFIVRDSKTSALIVVDAMFPVVEQAMLDRDIKNLIVVPLTGEKIPAGLPVFDEILERHPPNPPHVSIHPQEDLAVLQYTGGTTGLPKGVMLTHYNLVANAEMTREVLREWKEKFDENEEHLCMALLPFFHSYGLTVCLHTGLNMPAGLVLVPQFNADLILYLIKEYKPIIFPGVPTAFIALMNHPEMHNSGLDSIEVCISGAAPMPVEIIEQFEQKTGSSILEGYGLSEASPITHSNPFIGVRKPGSVGMPLPGTDCKIVDSDT